ncbi:helicase associated domain-containing protein [Streptomyces scopuliridis]|uniref:Helicase associated domain-containing protein n=1 Tax=Streptomyces scopuliridis TaxID=452529 RepID=A0ACD4ZC67_9ACTN|nr:helicase associated domain-containing protein [Streptomyces scopuliridis]WSB31614.1 helicase associated domain-containing protein [Streptomyces scopuliridis]WSB95862.1 helicase associated domain-containing protein [Streptomyces scopuliridis]WSC10431.1 helicase associated domain-containing protein [Streptomyces scopuliridis]
MTSRSGVWVADCRRHYNAGGLDDERTTQLEMLGMVWSSFDAGFEEGLAAAAAWAAEHEAGLAVPVDATYDEYPVGPLAEEPAGRQRAGPPSWSGAVPRACPSRTVARRHCRTSVARHWRRTSGRPPHRMT